MEMFEKAEDEYNDLMSKKSDIEVAPKVNEKDHGHTPLERVWCLKRSEKRVL
ncbi:unnamed protein product [Dovyalis caffra]|uniref:Uncharacterized protein n=1 Tax=Dovyalis caffra TaxID=77055 RepID=A0AAV1SLE2_9ROSI|nr:unnamed protein product [Dovyalis caffra]